MLGYVIGDSDMVTGLRLVGVEGVEVTSVDEARQMLETALARKDLAILIISEEFSSQPTLHEIIDKVHQERKDLLIVEIPGSKGNGSAVHMSDIITKTLGVRM
ncbi:MAG TPA: V-type ATP synthase subunit F [Candidatus Limnocylindrales bacterium]|nr:V-type ATP synthase subunit F [Candidatus Limnocylindrales bacterium]